MNESDRYEALCDMELQGQMIGKEWRAFMVYFEGTPSYERHKDYFEERRLKLASALGRSG